MRRMMKNWYKKAKKSYQISGKSECTKKDYFKIRTDARPYLWKSTDLISEVDLI